MKKLSVDKYFLLSIIILVIAGFIIFSSASLGLLAKGGELYSSAAFSQTFFGLFFGTIGAIIVSRIDYKKWRKYSFYLFILSVIATFLVFVPGLGLEFGGASRWIKIASFTFQTSELLKVAFIIYFSAWIAAVKNKISTFKYGFLPFLILLSVVGVSLLLQPDTDTFAVIIAAGMAMFLAGGGKIRYLFLLVLVSILGLLIIASARPYVKQRLTTFLNPTENSLSSSYQIQQSLIAIGSGGINGRGFGQSIQKFNFLPEPIGDSIFAVASEEFGFMGGVTLISFFLFFTIRGLKIAVRIDDLFGRMLVVGLVMLIVTQAFVNIGAMLGVIPLTGIPLPFISHGGSALLMVMIEVGIILNVSRYQKRSLISES